MARKKGKHNFLTVEEQEEFSAYAKKNKITYTKMAEIQGVSGGTISTWFKKCEVLKALRSNVQCQVENKSLKQTIGSVKEHLK